jgi:hypothetical protein
MTVRGGLRGPQWQRLSQYRALRTILSLNPSLTVIYSGTTAKVLEKQSNGTRKAWMHIWNMDPES